MVALALFLTAASQVGILNPFQGMFLQVVSPVQGAVDSVFRPVATLLSDAGELRQLQDEVRDLRIRNEELTVRVTQLQNSEERVKELEAALGVQASAGFGPTAPANVISHDASAFTDVISIDIGSDKGLKPGMNVLSPQGTLMGTVTRVLASRAFVRLITDSKSKVNAVVQETQFDGQVQGGPNRTLSFDLVRADVKVGDVIVTSGLGGNYQKDIPIGRIVEVSGTPQDLYKTVKVEPLVRFSTADTVLVLTSFVPERIVVDD